MTGPEIDEPTGDQRELRHLRELVGELREALERTVAEGQSQLQEADARYEGEMHQLRGTLTELRERLEAARMERDDAVLAERSRAAAEAPAA